MSEKTAKKKTPTKRAKRNSTGGGGSAPIRIRNKVNSTVRDAENQRLQKIRQSMTLASKNLQQPTKNSKLTEPAESPAVEKIQKKGQAEVVDLVTKRKTTTAKKKKQTPKAKSSTSTPVKKTSTVPEKKKVASPKRKKDTTTVKTTSPPAKNNITKTTSTPAKNDTTTVKTTSPPAKNNITKITSTPAKNTTKTSSTPAKNDTTIVKTTPALVSITRNSGKKRKASETSSVQQPIDLEPSNSPQKKMKLGEKSTCCHSFNRSEGKSYFISSEDKRACAHSFNRSEGESYFNGS